MIRLLRATLSCQPSLRTSLVLFQSTNGPEEQQITAHAFDIFPFWDSECVDLSVEAAWPTEAFSNLPTTSHSTQPAPPFSLPFTISLFSATADSIGSTYRGLVARRRRRDRASGALCIAQDIQIDAVRGWARMHTVGTQRAGSTARGEVTSL